MISNDLSKSDQICRRFPSIGDVKADMNLLDLVKSFFRFSIRRAGNQRRAPQENVIPLLHVLEEGIRQIPSVPREGLPEVLFPDSSFV